MALVNDSIKASLPAQRPANWLLSFIFLFLSCCGSLLGQQDSTNHLTPMQRRQRVMLVACGGAAAYGAALPVLYADWYKNYPQTNFHFFNDDDEWQQMDKCGHTFTAYYEGVYGIRLMKWAGLTDKQAAWYGGTWGLLLQTSLEVMDGFSKEWGFSWGDMTANTVGAGLAISQQLAWHEQKIQIKFSYTPSHYQALNPNLLGVGYLEGLIKDYNGQTYWLSFPLRDISGITQIPSWLNIAVGYGADGMLRGSAADQYAPLSPYLNYARYRQFYLSLDLNMLRIKTRSKVLNDVLRVVSFIKIPAPAIEYNTNQNFKFHLLHF